MTVALNFRALRGCHSWKLVIKTLGRSRYRSDKKNIVYCVQLHLGFSVYHFLWLQDIELVSKTEHDGLKGGAILPLSPALLIRVVILCSFVKSVCQYPCKFGP